MADSERLETGGRETGEAMQRREELDELLHRIAVHIAEVDKSAAAQREPAAGSDAVDAVPQDRAGAEPPPLRSAMKGRGAEVPPRREASEGSVERGARDEHSSPLSRAHDSGARAEPHVTDEPWDSDTAEALTRSYETEAAVPPLRSILNLMAQKGSSQNEAEVRAADRPGAASHGEISHADIDAAQTRLFEAARRVETMLDRLAPRGALEALGDRFETLEGEVRRSGGQLARLDGIEHRLDVLGEKLSDEQVLNLFGSLVPTADELTQFAVDAAGRAAERVLEAHARDTAAPAHADPQSASASAMGNQLDALADVLGTFMDERRRNEASTLEALETLQLAMQHVLDRIERVDERPAPASAPIAHVGATLSDALSERARLEARSTLNEEPDQFQLMDPAASEIDDQPGEMINLTANQFAGAPNLTAESYSMPAEGVHGHALPLDADGDGETGPRPHRRVEASAQVPRPGTSPQSGHAAGEGQPSGDRQAFIAMARQAAERARSQADQSARGKPETPAPAKARKRGAIALGASTGIVRPGVLLVAIAAILFAGYWFLFGQKHGLLRPFVTVSVEQPVAAAFAANRVSPQSGTQNAAPTGKAMPADTAAAGWRPGNTAKDPAIPASLPGHQETSAAAVATEAAAPGMAISFDSSPATFDTVMKARERSRLAGLSQRAAFSAVSSNGDQETAAPVPTAARPQPSVPPRHTSAIETSAIAGNAASASSPSVTAGARGARQMNLPPAAAGPLSLRLAAAEGDAAAQLEIATRLAEGRGVRQSFAEAARWYERAADQGQAIAQYRLATLYERGMGVKADREKAQSLYERAAAQGNLKAMHNLAVISASATAGAADYVTAARLFSRAAQHGLHDSQYNLGVLYESGLGVPKDHGAAYKWYSLAARSGDTAAARRRDMLISRLPPETIQAMDVQIAAWQAATADEAANNVRVAGSGWMQGGGQTRRQ